MRIAVEGLGATVGPADGAGRYTLGVLEALSRRDDVEVVAFVGPSMRESVSELGGIAVKEVIDAPGRGGRLLAQHVRVPRAAARAEADVFLCLGNYAPLLDGPPLVSVLLSLLLAVGDPSFGWKHALYRRFMRGRIARRAAAVVAISRTLASALEEASPQLRGRIRLVRPPLDAAGVLASEPVPAAAAPPEYFLAVGRPWGYREYPLALRALAQSGLPHALVIVGDAAPEERRPLEELAAELGLEGRLWFRGVVTSVGELRSWYEGAASLVATSRLESFGQPLGEAMACGTPVVAVERTVFPETLGDAGLLVEPTPDALALALRRVVQRDVRADLAERGRRRAVAGSWDECAAELIRICREATRSG